MAIVKSLNTLSKVLYNEELTFSLVSTTTVHIASRVSGIIRHMNLYIYSNYCALPITEVACRTHTYILVNEALLGNAVEISSYIH